MFKKQALSASVNDEGYGGADGAGGWGGRKHKAPETLGAACGGTGCASGLCQQQLK